MLSVGDDPNGSSYRSFVKIRWDAGHVNDYRRGHEGSLNVKCVTPAEGEKYYTAHLPKLGNHKCRQIIYLFVCLFYLFISKTRVKCITSDSNNMKTYQQ